MNKFVSNPPKNQSKNENMTRKTIATGELPASFSIMCFGARHYHGRLDRRHLIVLRHLLTQLHGDKQRVHRVGQNGYKRLNSVREKTETCNKHMHLTMKIVIFNHRRRSVYNIVGVHGNGETQRAETWVLKRRRAKLEGPRGFGFLGRGCSLPVSKGIWGSAVSSPIGVRRPGNLERFIGLQTGWPLFFNNDFRWLFHHQKKWIFMTYRHSIFFFEITDTRFMNAYQNKNIFPVARQSVSK